MDSLLEYLIPLIIVVFWIFGKMMEGRGQSRDDSGENEHSHEDGSWDSWEQDEETERTRRIQEEIRRKIAERRGEPAPPPLPGRPAAQGRPVFPQPTTYHTEPQVIRVEPPRRNYAAELEAREKELAKTLKKADEIRAGAEQAFPKGRLARTAREARTARTARKANHQNLRHALHQEVIDGLQNPDAARKAFLFYEILGTPVALRTDGHPKLISDT